MIFQFFRFFGPPRPFGPPPDPPLDPPNRVAISGKWPPDPPRTPPNGVLDPPKRPPQTARMGQILGFFHFFRVWGGPEGVWGGKKVGFLRHLHQEGVFQKSQKKGRKNVKKREKTVRNGFLRPEWVKFSHFLVSRPQNHVFSVYSIRVARGFEDSESPRDV